MFKLLVNSPNGYQEIVGVTATGSYFDNARVIWDERTDGTLPAITLGGMVRQDDLLVFDQDTKDAHDAAIAAMQTRVDRHQELDAGIAGDSTLSSLKQMGNTEINNWFDNNITDASSAIQLLKRIVKVLIRRVL